MTVRHSTLTSGILPHGLKSLVCTIGDTPGFVKHRKGPCFKRLHDGDIILDFPGRDGTNWNFPQTN